MYFHGLYASKKEWGIDWDYREISMTVQSSQGFIPVSNKRFKKKYVPLAWDFGTMVKEIDALLLKLVRWQEIFYSQLYSPKMARKNLDVYARYQLHIEEIIDYSLIKSWTS